jgi:hypothetical protein
MSILQNIQALTKALEAGQITGAPGTLVQGSALQIHEMDGVMHNVTFGDEHIKLQKIFPVKKQKNTLVRFKRQLSYGEFGSSAQLEGAVGQEEVGDYVEAVVPMAYYSHIRRTTLAANLVESFDGIKAEDREAANAAMKIAADIEFDCFQGKAHFSNAGVFDGNPLAIGVTPNLTGLDVQIRQSDIQSNTQDQMFAEFGSSESVVLSAGGGTLSQILVEDLALRSRLNFGKAERLMLDPVALSAYNKLVLQSSANVNQFATMGQALTSSGADLRSQLVSEGSVKMETSHFLRGKYRPARVRAGAPAAPVLTGVGTPTIPSGLIPSGSYIYKVTAVNDKGEGVAAVMPAVSLNGTQGRTFTIAAQGTVGTRYFNVYRSDAGGTADSAKFIGRIAYNGQATVTFSDLGNKVPAFTNGYLIESSEEIASLRELAPYSRAKMAIQDLSSAEAHFRFVCLAVYQPRKLVICDNLRGTFK